MRRFPVADHCAQLLALVIEKMLFLVGELGRRQRKQFCPRRPAGKQVAIPPHRAGLDRIALGRDIGGSALRNAASMPSLTSIRRSHGQFNGIASKNSSTASKPISSAGSAQCSASAAINAAPIAKRSTASRRHST